MSACSRGHLWHAWLVRATPPASSENRRRRLTVRRARPVCGIARGGLSAVDGTRRCFRVVRCCSSWQALGAGRTGLSRRPVEGRTSAAGGVAARSAWSGFSTSPPPPGGLSCLAGLALDSQRRHWQRRLACDAGRRFARAARGDGAFGRTAREWCSACVVRLDPAAQPPPPRVPFQSWGERRSGSLEVGFLCCIPDGITTYKRSPFGPRAPCAGRTGSRPRVPRLRRSAVRWRGPRVAVRTLGFGRRSGHGGLHGLPERPNDAP
ncbi:hypothetical protein RND71_019084 [Anisodus tanguticus]|uniref:Uncharacterized protein n=1 Tax=Anisodus tanguticus TaxID=243964 RepID=A0AAE1RYT1_9SOLA|nr:hypothetical protein RND71_019084 [Anisodus tanguticus]